MDLDNAGHYAKAIVGGAVSGGGTVIIAYLVAKLSDGLALTWWGAIPGDVQGALAAAVIGGITSWAVYRTSNAPRQDLAPIAQGGPLVSETAPKA